MLSKTDHAIDLIAGTVADVLETLARGCREGRSRQERRGGRRAGGEDRRAPDGQGFLNSAVSDLTFICQALGGVAAASGLGQAAVCGQLLGWSAMGPRYFDDSHAARALAPGAFDLFAEALPEFPALPEDSVLR